MSIFQFARPLFCWELMRLATYTTSIKNFEEKGHQNYWLWRKNQTHVENMKGPIMAVRFSKRNLLGYRFPSGAEPVSMEIALAKSKNEEK